MKIARDIIFDYLRDLEIEYIFGVPGTNEIPIIDGTSVLENHVTYVPCLHENIALGAAMGYARMTGKPGVVVLHVTPGVGHSLGNLFNAYKSHIPLLVLCGQQHNSLLVQEPLLASDLVQVARQYTKWAYELRSADEFPLVIQRALKVATAPATGPVLLSLPWNFTLQEVKQVGRGQVTRIAPYFTGDPAAVSQAAQHLATAKSPIIVAGDGVGAARAWEELRELVELIGAPVYTEQLSSMMNYPNNLPHWQGELPGHQKDIQDRFKGHDVAFLCGFNAQSQLVVYDYALGPLIPDSVTQVYLHNDPWEIGKNHYGDVAILGDIKSTLPLLNTAIIKHHAYNAKAAAARNKEIIRLGQKREELFAAANKLTQPAQTSNPSISILPPPDTYIEGSQVAETLGQFQKELGIPMVYVHEAISDSPFFQKYLNYPNPISYFGAEGGSLGYSMPASLGIKLAVKDKAIVVNAVGDGSALFYPQVWWTATKFNLPILYIILNNKEYKTLIVGLEDIESYYNWKPTNPQAPYLHLAEPPLSFVQLAASFGVRGVLVSESTELHKALQEGFEAVKEGQAYIVEVLTDPVLSPAVAQQKKPRLDIFFAAKEGLM